MALEDAMMRLYLGFVIYIVCWDMLTDTDVSRPVGRSVSRPYPSTTKPAVPRMIAGSLMLWCS